MDNGVYLTQIFARLDVTSLLRVKEVCRGWEAMARDVDIWRRLTLDFCSVAEEMWKELMARCKPRPIPWNVFYWELLHDYNKIKNPLFCTDREDWKESLMEQYSAIGIRAIF
eukprot:TRINITY_DN4724_c0_g1_i1.p1 TRINITY_DN4724_c0_g1~~TRINITY_DN4724_c0_g1_i1.p1  ORF type:complete len:119 (-),score=31.29 TRINITY_DN4724_c0_g1_i1:411-746(-)